MQYVVVTGACGGMGRATVKKFSDMGYGVFALDRVALDEQLPNVVSIVTDVTDGQSVQSAAAIVAQNTTTLHAVVHFAGIYMLDSLVEMDEEDFRRIVNVNFVGAYLVNKAFAPLLQHGSRIVITTSELAPLDPLPFTGIYGVTKAALDKYAFSLAMEMQLWGVSVSVLRAGAVSTGMLGVSTDALEKFCNKTQLYQCNAARFKKIVDSVESRSVSPDKIANKVAAIVAKRKPKFAYSINRNLLLLLLNLLPKRTQLWVIKQVLKS